MHYINDYPSPLGNILMASDGTALTGLWFVNQTYFAANLPAEHTKKKLAVFEEARRWLDTYFHGTDPGPLPALSMTGSPFRTAVWNILKEIPYGQVTTYGEIAAEIARQKGISHMSAQAVGSAVGHNPVSIIVPCHRVVGTHGSLTGYAGGIRTKEALLRLEGIDTGKYFIPADKEEAAHA